MPGPELVQYGDFSDATPWTAGDGWEIQTENNLAQWTSGSGQGLLSQDISIAAGKTYRVSFTVISAADADVTPSVGGTTGTLRYGAGTYVEFLEAADTTGIVFDPSALDSESRVIKITNVSVKETDTCDVHVTDEDGNALSGVTVTATDSSPTQIFSVETNAYGNIEQQPIKTDLAFRFTFSITGYQDHQSGYVSNGIPINFFFAGRFVREITADIGLTASLEQWFANALTDLTYEGEPVFKTADIWKHQVGPDAGGMEAFSRYEPLAFIGYQSDDAAREGDYDLREVIELAVLIGVESKVKGIARTGDDNHLGTSKIRDLVIAAFDRTHPGTGFECDDIYYTGSVEVLDSPTRHAIQMNFEVSYLNVNSE